MSLTTDMVKAQNSSTGSFSKVTGYPDDTKSVIGDKYVLVRLKDGDQKVRQNDETGNDNVKSLSGLPIPPLKRSGENVFSLSSVKSSVAKAGVKLPVVRTKLWFPANNTSAANTANTFSFGVAPSGSTEFASFAALYEECKVSSGAVHFDVSTSAAPLTNNTDLSVISYDPLSVAALTSVADGCEDAQHKLFKSSSLLSTLTSPLPVTGRGLWRFPFKVPSGSARTTASTAVFGGSDWSLTADASDVYGYLKWYIPALGAAITSTIQSMIELDVEFRSRV
jgi:hypothetical protein